MERVQLSYLFTGILNLPSPAKSLRLGEPATVESESIPGKVFASIRYQVNDVGTLRITKLFVIFSHFSEDLSVDAPILENHPQLPSGMTDASVEREAAGMRTVHPLVPVSIRRRLDDLQIFYLRFEP